MFIKLTRYDAARGASLGEVYLNPDRIESLGISRRWINGTPVTVVSLGHGTEYTVKETAEEILGQINQVAQEELLPKIRFINGEAVEVRG